MARHHFVPQFLLREWAKKGQLISYTRIPATGLVKPGRTSVVNACQVDGLNAFFGLPKTKREAPERDFWTPHVDTPAAVAHRKILDKGVRALSAQEREAWATLLVSFGVRTPETLRTMGPDVYRKAMAQSQANPTESPEVESVVNDLIAAEMAALERNIPIRISMELASDPNKISAINRMMWWTRKFTGERILLGDRPLISTPTAKWPCGIALDVPGCVVGLPVSPNTMFFASANSATRTHMRKMWPPTVLCTINEEQIWRSVDYVFAANSTMEAFVTERIAGKADGSWGP